MEQALNELKLKEAKIREDEERIQKEKEWVANNQLKKEKKIKLNVGGTYYTTTLTTLKSDPDSMLAAMFSGRFPIEKDEDDGAYFIDRNGRVFGHILDWLRTGELCPELSNEDTFWLRKEVEYYQLTKLSAILSKANIQPKNTDERDIICLYYADWFHQYQVNHPGLGLGGRTYSSHSCYQWFMDEISVWLKKGYNIIEKGLDNNKSLYLFVVLAK